MTSDQPVNTLHVFRTERVLRGLASYNRIQKGTFAQFEVTFRSSADGSAAIVDATWQPNGLGILFRALTDGKYGGYHLDVQTGRVEKVVASEDSVGWFTYRAGRRILRTERLAWHDPSLSYPLAPVTLSDEGHVYTSRLQALEFGTAQFISAHSGTIVPYPDQVEDAAISPDGQFAAIYQMWPHHKFTVVKFGPTGAPTPISSIQAASDRFRGTRMLWSKDSDTLILIGVRRHESSSPEEAGVVAALNLRTSFWTYLPSSSKRVFESAAWRENESHLTLHWREAPARTGSETYIIHAGRFVRENTRSDARALSDVEVYLDQNQNEPPMIVARRLGQALALLPPDTALKGIRLTPVQRFTWRDYEGKSREAGLLLPAGYKRGSPVPLIVQPYYYLPQLFLPDGNFRTAHAAQALAASGFAVLLLETIDLVPTEIGTDRKGPPSEGPKFIQRIDAVIDELLEQNITEPDKIALLGFSRGGYQTYYYMTHPRRTCLAAAVVADAATLSYPAYLEETATGVRLPTAFQARGRSPWEDPMYWLQNDVTLNVDRTRTPALFFESMNRANDNSGHSLQTIGAYRLNRKPIEFITLKDAYHNLRRPLQRVAVMSAEIDWLNFWLLKREDPNPAKTAQYIRWRKLRAEWADINSREFVPGDSCYIVTRSGMMYSITTRKSGQQPRPGDLLSVDLVGRRLDGSEFVNTHTAKTPIRVRLRPPACEDFSQIRIAACGPSGAYRLSSTDTAGTELGLGWDEILRLLHVGEKASIVMPSELARGIPGLPNENGPFRFELEVLDVSTSSDTSSSVER